MAPELQGHVATKEKMPKKKLPFANLYVNITKNCDKSRLKHEKEKGAMK